MWCSSSCTFFFNWPLIMRPTGLNRTEWILIKNMKLSQEFWVLPSRCWLVISETAAAAHTTKQLAFENWERPRIFVCITWWDKCMCAKQQKVCPAESDQELVLSSRFQKWPRETTLWKSTSRAGGHQLPPLLQPMCIFWVLLLFEETLENTHQTNTVWMCKLWIPLKAALWILTEMFRMQF